MQQYFFRKKEEITLNEDAIDSGIVEYNTSIDNSIKVWRKNCPENKSSLKFILCRKTKEKFSETTTLKSFAKTSQVTNPKVGNDE